MEKQNEHRRMESTRTRLMNKKRSRSSTEKHQYRHNNNKRIRRQRPGNKSTQAQQHTIGPQTNQNNNEPLKHKRNHVQQKRNNPKQIMTKTNDHRIHARISRCKGP